MHQSSDEVMIGEFLTNIYAEKQMYNTTVKVEVKEIVRIALSHVP